jgi:hypothetical protein
MLLGINPIPPGQNAHTQDQRFADQPEPPVVLITAPD